MKELKLGQPAISWHTVRDCIAEVGCFLGLVTGSCGKIAFDVKLLMQTEVEEVYEPFHAGRGSSSTMPQKRNPISSVYITAQTAMVKQLVAALLEAQIEDHERATGPWEIEWIALPEIFMLSAGALAQTRFLVEGLQVNEKKMRENLDITKGLIMSEAVMMGLGAAMGRNKAHDVVYDICREVVKTGRPLIDLLAEDKEISQAHRPQAPGKAGRPGELPGRRRRNGRPRAGDARPVIFGAHSAAAAFAAACSRTNFCTAKWSTLPEPRTGILSRGITSAGIIRSEACLLLA